MAGFIERARKILKQSAGELRSRALTKAPKQDGEIYGKFSVFRGSHRGAGTRRIEQYRRNFVGELRRAHCSGVSMSAEISATLQIPPIQHRKWFLSLTSFSNFWLQTRTHLGAWANHEAPWGRNLLRSAKSLSESQDQSPLSKIVLHPAKVYPENSPATLRNR